MKAQQDQPYLVFLNLKSLRPESPKHWDVRVPRICTRMANEHKIPIHVFIGSYIEDNNFTLLARDGMDLGDDRDMASYRDAEAKLHLVIEEAAKE